MKTANTANKQLIIYRFINDSEAREIYCETAASMLNSGIKYVTNETS